MPEARCWGRRVWHRSYALSVRFSPFRLLLTLWCLSCDLLPHPGDTEGIQNQAHWVSGGRLVVDTDPRLTIVRLDIDTTPGAPRGGGAAARPRASYSAPAPGPRA